MNYPLRSNICRKCKHLELWHGDFVEKGWLSKCNGEGKLCPCTGFDALTLPMNIELGI